MIGIISLLLSESRIFTELVRREIRIRYVGTRFGLLWSIFTPTIQLIAYSVIFGNFHSTTSRSRGDLVASLFCGLWPWWMFQDGVNRGLVALADHGDLLRRLPIAPEICIAANVTASVILQAVGFALFLAVFTSLGIVAPRLCWLLLILWLVMALLVTMGVAMVLAPLFAVLRDVLFAVNALMMVGFFASPVLYERSALPLWFEQLSLLNPIASLIEINRAIVMGNPMSVLCCLSLGGGTVAAFEVARRVFSRARVHLDEFI